jgi:diguanylate cyclase (GGDEF)-like protein/PAS domain S-box-containing protein
MVRKTHICHISDEGAGLTVRPSSAAGHDEAAGFHAQALEAIGQAVVVTDLEGRVQYCNKAAESLFGSGAEAWVTPGADAPTEGARDLLDASGGTLTAYVASTPVLGGDGNVAATLHLVSDVDDSSRRRAHEAGVQRLAMFDALGQRASDLALLIDPSATMLHVSPSVQTVLAYDPADLVGRSAWDFVHPDDADLARSALDEALATPGASATATIRVIDAASRWRWLEAVLTNRLDDPHIGAIVFNGRDVDERVSVEQALRASEARYRAIADTAQEGIWAVEVSGRTLYANAKLAAILGVDLSSIYQTNVAEVLSPHDGFIADKLRHRAERGPEVYEITYEHPDGDQRVLQLSVRPLLDEGGHATSLGMITDITATHEAEEELRSRSLHDDLTGLANRTLLADRLEHALARREHSDGGPVAVISADLDQFKLINESWGHSAGDDLLAQVAGRLAASARGGDTVARFGSDEFVIVCEDTDEKQARHVADELLRALTVPFDVAGRRVHVSASIGIAVTPPDSAQELLRFADAAMYDAKARGRGQVHVFDAELADAAADRLQMSNDLREALERNQLNLCYQPVIDLGTGKLIGLEALARWTHPRHGNVSPSVFVAVAEATGLAAALGQWALEQATQELEAVRRVVGSDIRVAVNISARHLADPDFEATVLGAVTAHKVPRGGLLLEITESAVMTDPEQIQKVLERLRMRGVEAAIDDFGTGYSTLGHLNTLPVSMLKIDRTFIDRMTKDPDSLAIAASIVDLARIMKLTTVAEGVETVEQLAILHQLGCPAGQGFLWSPALPLSELGRLIGRLPGRRFDVTLHGRGASAPPPAFPGGQVTVEHGLQQIMRMHKAGASHTTIAAALNTDGFRTPRGLRWHRATVARVISDCAYPHLWSPADDGS